MIYMKILTRNRNKNKFYKDGRPKPANWEYRFETASIGGKRYHHSESGFNTKKDALDAGTAALAEYNKSGQIFTPSDMSFSDYLDYWLDTYCKTNLAQSTCDTYRKRINNHIRPTLGEYYLKSITPAALQDLINEKFNSGYSRNTLTDLKGILTGAFSYAVEPCRYIAQSPAIYIKLPQPRATSEDVPTREKIRRVVTHEEWNHIMARFPKGSTAHIPLILGYRCGLRISEAFAITWSDIDFDKGTLSVNRQVQKYDGDKLYTICNPKYDSFRTISLDTKTIELLQEEKDHQEKAKLFYREFHRQAGVDKDNHIVMDDPNAEPMEFVTQRENGEYIKPDIMKHVSRVIHGKATKNGIAISEDWDFHSLRHTHATILLEKGVQMPMIQYRLGHTDVEITERYVHPTTAMNVQVEDIINELY